MTATYNMFEAHGRGPRKRRSPHSRKMAHVTEQIIHEALPSLCDDRVIMAEVGASAMCIGYYVDEVFGQGDREFGAAAPLPALRILDEFGPRTNVHPFALALCAAGLARISPDPEVHELAQRIIETYGQTRGEMDMWPEWRELPLVVPEQAWQARDEEGRIEMIVTSWRDANGRPHAFAASSYAYDVVGDDVGQAIDSIVLGDTGEELVNLFSEPIDELEGMQFEQISLSEAGELLQQGIEDVSLAAQRMLPRDLPMTTLAFLEHRRDLLA